MVKRDSCKCGSINHKNTNNPKCQLYQRKTRKKYSFCHSCKSTTHLRRSSKLCPNNKVIKNNIISLDYYSIFK